MTDDRKESSSPACLAHEADDAYMGFASQAEIDALLAELRSAGRHPSAELRAKGLAMLPRVRDDQLHRQLQALLGTAPS